MIQQSKPKRQSHSLRDYQRKAVEAILAAFLLFTKPVVVLPTGSGKSHVAATVAMQSSGRIIIIVPSKELVEQNFAKLMQADPDCDAGIYCAGLNQYETDNRVIVASIQSIYNKAHLFGEVEVVIIDEAHRLNSDTGMFRRFIDELKPKHVCGLTATPYRLDSGPLVGDGQLFDGIAYECKIKTLIETGYLSPIRGKDSASSADTSKLRKRGGDFRTEEAAAAMANVTEAACIEIAAFMKDRTAGIAFAVDIPHAEETTRLLQAAGLSVGLVHSQMSNKQRDNTIERFRNRELQILVNVSVLTTGFDFPLTDLIAILRPTASPGLFVQIVGRGMRIAPGKTDCLILDYGGNIERHGGVCDIQPPSAKRKGGGGEAPIIVCPDCREVVPASAMQCSECGHRWERKQSRHDATASTLDPMANSGIAVREVEYLRHKNSGKPPMMLMRHYLAGGRVVDAYLCIEHGTKVKHIVRRMWTERGGRYPIPTTTNEALQRQHELHTPTTVGIKKNARGFTEIVSLRFEEVAA